jgi:hypothetical protein
MAKINNDELPAGADMQQAGCTSASAPALEIILNIVWVFEIRIKIYKTKYIYLDKYLT